MLGIALVALLFLPAAAHLVTSPENPDVEAAANAPGARWWRRAGERLDPWINAHYGLRSTILGAGGLLRYGLRSPGTRLVYFGRDGQLFYSAELATEGSAGTVFRRAGLERFVSMARELRARTAARGARLVVASPPNAQTARSEWLPAWARPRSHPVEYTYVMEQLAAAGVQAVDLRDIVQDTPGREPSYQLTDTHWNSRGALLGFNAMLSAAGYGELRINPALALGPGGASTGGDLARMLNVSDFVQETAFVPWAGDVMSPGKERPLDVPLDTRPSYAFATVARGPSIAVIGDSFTDDRWRALLALTGRRVFWAHFRSCTFDWTKIEAFKPDLLVLAPTERNLVCGDRAWPNGLPGG